MKAHPDLNDTLDAEGGEGVRARHDKARRFNGNAPPASAPPISGRPMSTSKSATSKKLDWLEAVRFDRSLLPIDYKVASALAKHMNSQTGQCNPSDPLLALEVGCSVRTVNRARERLRDAGWIAWRRTRTSSRFQLLHDKVADFLNQMKAARAERRKRRQGGDEDKPL